MTIDSFISSLTGNSLSFSSISNITVNDLMDILIIQFFIYTLLMWIKETRAWSLLKGLTVVGIVSLASRIFNLNTVWWIITTMFNIGLIAIIVIFQPELRKALEQIGKGRIASPFSSADQDKTGLTQETVKEIIRAAKYMSERRTGALIVIERNVALGDMELNGIPIDAIITSQLLINIFENKTPLHDGAVTIRNNRVSAATCILPLSSDELARELGTRHRAAVGASEVSDADVLVVSEETGAVSIAQGGRLHRGLSEEEMREMLVRNKPEEKKKRFTWRIENENPSAK